MTQPRVVASPMKSFGEHVTGDRVERSTVVILGGGGDLMKRKLLPALYYLAAEKLLPSEFNLIGVGRDALEDKAYIEMMRAALNASDEIKSVDEGTWKWFSSRIRYAHGDLGTAAAYQSIKRCLDEIESPVPEEKRNRIFYLAVPPSVFQTSIEHLSTSGLAPKTAEDAARPF
ncbi:MAG: glucose-6-phosphate dehydrogenase, partial [Gemmatimonadaceae bacterium]